MYNGLKAESYNIRVELRSFHSGRRLGLCSENTKDRIAVDGGRSSSLQTPKLLEVLFGGQQFAFPWELVAAKPTVSCVKMEARYMGQNSEHLVDPHENRSKVIRFSSLNIFHMGLQRDRASSVNN